MGIRTGKKKRTPKGSSDSDTGYLWGAAGQKAAQPRGFEMWENEKGKKKKKKKK